MARGTFRLNSSLWSPLYTDWQWLLIGAVFSFFFASVLLSGWPSGLIPDLNYPYAYRNDASFIGWQIQRVMESWLVDNPRSGYPFGSNFLDYPHSDNGNLIVLKLFAMFTGTYYGAFNLYTLAGFSIVFIFSYLVFRAIALKKVYAFSAALLFAFTPFHFWRVLIGHIYYGWYFVVPLYFFYGWRIFCKDLSIWPLNNLRKIFKLIAVMIVLSSFGFYFAVFGIIIFLACGFAAAIKQKNLQTVLLSMILSALVAFGIGLNILPNIVHQLKNSRNVEIATRAPVETEVYALKLSHLLLPIENHRIKSLRKPFKKYTDNFAVNEAANSSSLGFLGVIGFFILIFCIFSNTLGQPGDFRLSVLALLVFTMLLISTVGGMSVFFALYVTPLIRGWNRISIFISFAVLAALFLTVQEHKKLKILTVKYNFLPYLLAFSLVIFGFSDQIPANLTLLTTNAKNNFVADKNFIMKIEESLPMGAAIYQLPYMAFPETGARGTLFDYDLLSGYLHSKSLKWSHGGVKGRAGDLFYRALSWLPLDEQIKQLKNLGFLGIYLDRRGLETKEADLVNQMTLLLGPPALVREDTQVLFFRIRT